MCAYVSMCACVCMEGCGCGHVCEGVYEHMCIPVFISPALGLHACITMSGQLAFFFEICFSLSLLVEVILLVYAYYNFF